jgi:hypothetical protein
LIVEENGASFEHDEKFGLQQQRKEGRNYRLFVFWIQQAVDVSFFNDLSVLD